MDIIQVFGGNARICIKEFMILVHGMQVAAINTLNQGASIKDIYSQNSGWKDEIKIV